MEPKKLKVAEAIQDDVNKGVVRIDTNFMKAIGVRPGDIVEISGERKTVAIVDRAYPGDIGLDIIRMDGIIRRNAKAGIGELVQLSKAEVKEAKKVVIAPDRKGIMVQASPQIFKSGLLGRALVTGDIVSLGGTQRRRTALSESSLFDDVFNLPMDDLMGFGFGDLKFRVISTMPKSAVIISELTTVEFNPEAVEVTEEGVLEVTYEDIGGLDEELVKIREMVELPLKHPEIFTRLGIEPPKGVLLQGPPGTGKTLLAKAVASESNAHFILINGPEIMSKYYGQSEQNLRKKFEEAEKNAPSIIFIDEIDAIASKREEVHGEVERRVVAQLLALMDGLKARGKVIVIAATNVPNLLDPALRRPGRFDRELEIGVPDKEGRLKILKIHTRGMPLLNKDSFNDDSDFVKKFRKKDIVNLEELASVTHGFVGADLESLAKEAAMIVLRRMLPKLKLKEDEPIPKEFLEELRVKKSDFKEALKVVRPSAM
ncbi:AAA family ATPase, partial [Candidatus Woesearchaeota archaeon]|nr:AAA family ATPase [Candidatus Woesearchaeota archaeon]